MLARAALVTVAAAVVAGCASFDRQVPNGRLDADDVRRLARTSGVPLYYAGLSFAGLPLTDGDASSRGGAFVYGTCELPPGEGGCAPPIQIQHFAFDPNAWRRAGGCRSLGRLRGVPAVRHDGLVLVTERALVKVYARSAREARRVVDALVRADGRPTPRRLPSPSAEAARIVAAACPAGRASPLTPRP